MIDPREMLAQQLMQQGQARSAMQGQMGAWRGGLPQYRGTQNGQTPGPSPLMPRYQGNRNGASLPLMQSMLANLQPMVTPNPVDMQNSVLSPDVSPTMSSPLY